MTTPVPSSFEWTQLMQPLLTGGAALFGVWFAGSLTEGRERRREDARIQTERTYLAILVASHLDRLANACLSIALDDGRDEYGAPAGPRGEHAPTTKDPAFAPLDFEVEWKALPQSLMLSVLRLPMEIERLGARVAAAHESHWDPPDHIEFFHLRQRGYAELGLKVGALARELEALVGIPAQKAHPHDWSRDSELRSIISGIDHAAALRGDARAASQVFDAAFVTDEAKPA
ncbi:hypothetical protein [Roseateles asaccharophilus]|uniref:Uncharacterized protein n=1 Tax=Roseateles asaccharophilus TaxID=582607 RepID=A0ABU2A3F6_9BURK|nr:hypothetical protein [Roseateles asaccharophilus]MDR7331725.1 hypothetical protein [Roseateles asaccharophilus]